MSLISKLFVKLSPTKYFYTTQKIITPNFVNETRRNISKRFTIGKDCKPPKEEPECPKTCRKVKKTDLPMSQACIDSKKCGEDRTKPVTDFGNAKYSRKNMGDHIAKIVKKPGKYTTSKCDPFPREEYNLKKKLVKCKPSMRHPCDPPAVEHKCSVTSGKILYTTNERPKQTLPNCPKGNWNYTDRRNKPH